MYGDFIINFQVVLIKKKNYRHRIITTINVGIVTFYPVAICELIGPTFITEDH